ncbi:MAG: DUF58 domain-containing protein [Zestosphaera sp.]
MYLGRVSTLVLAASSLMIVTGFYNALTLGDLIYIVYSSVAAVLYVRLTGFPRLLTGLTWCLLAVGETPLSTLASIILSVLTPYVHDVVAREPLEGLLSLRLSSIVLVFTPLYLLRPCTLIPAMSYVTSILVLTTISYLHLSRSRVLLERTSYSIHLGEHAEVTVGVDVLNNSSYSIVINDIPVMRGSTRGSNTFTVRLSPRTAGVHTYFLKVALSDLRHFSRLVHGPYAIRVKAIPKSMVIVRRVRELLSRYVSLVRTPTIYVGRLELIESRRASRGGGSDGEGAGASVAGATPLRVGEGIVGDIVGEEGLSSSRRVGARFRFRWVIPTKILESIERQTVGTLAGDYVGVREYYPGDHPRSIHWKKSASIGDLVVKVFTHGKEGGGGRPSLIVADWDASNPLELDNLIQATYSALLTVDSTKTLYLRLPNGKIYFIKGDLASVLNALDLIIRIEDVEARFNYDSWVRERARSIIEELKNGKGFLKSLDQYYRALTQSIVEGLEEHGLVKGSNFFILHPRAHTLKYTYLAHALRMKGYTTTRVVKLLQPDEVVEKLRDLITSLPP